MYADYIEDIKSSYNRAIEGEGKLFKIDADFKMVSVSRDYNGIESIEINAENIYLTSGKVIFLPESLSFSLSYSVNLNNVLGSSDRKTEYIDTGLNIYNNQYLNIRFDHYNHRFTSIIKNKNNNDTFNWIYIEDKPTTVGGDGNGFDTQRISGGEEYKTDDSFYLRNSVIIKSSFSGYKNYGLSYGLEEGSKPHPYEIKDTSQLESISGITQDEIDSLSNYVYADVRQKGTRIGLGYYGEVSSEEGSYLEKIEVYQRKFTRYYKNYFLCSAELEVLHLFTNSPACGNTGSRGSNERYQLNSVEWEGKLSKPTFGYTITGGWNISLSSYQIRLNGSLDYEKQEYEGYLGNWDLTEETYTYTLGGGITF